MARRVGSYRAAIDWIAVNDDTDWLDHIDACPSVTLSLVADVFGRSDAEAKRDLEAAVRKLRVQGEHHA